MKNIVCTVCGTIGTFLAAALGGWDTALITLVAFMGIDLITGFLVAWVFHASPKTESGGVNSKVSFIGICKKCVVLLLVIVANLLDNQTGASYFRDGVCIAFMVNELVSILENAALMGIPIPKVITKGLDILKTKQEGSGEQ